MSKMKFQPVAFKNPQTKEVGYTPRLKACEEVTLEQIAAAIEKTSTVSEADTRAVLSALQRELRENLAAGRIVALGDMGRYRVSCSGKTVPKAEECKARNIEKLRIIWTPSKRLASTISTTNTDIHFERVDEAVADGGGPVDP